MISATLNKTSSIRFRRWTRKNYAIFASLHKVISIGSIVISICNQSVKKIKQQISLDSFFGESTDLTQENDLTHDELLSLQLAVSTITTSDDVQRYLFSIKYKSLEQLYLYKTKM